MTLALIRPTDRYLSSAINYTSWQRCRRSNSISLTHAACITFDCILRPACRMRFVISCVNRLSSRYGPPVSVFAFKSYCDRRLAIEPRPRLLELRGQSKQRRLVAVARDELNRDRESSRGPLR